MTNPDAPVEMLNIPVKDIDIGNRARKEYPNLGALAEDIRQKGLIHPIAVKRTGGQPPYMLLAGGRRLAAVTFAGLPTIPCRIYPESLSELDFREIELMENLSRENLTWTETAFLREEIHKLQVEKFGTAHGPSTGHSISQTAELVNASKSAVHRDLKLAKGLREHPKLAKAKNASEALRTLERMEKTQRNQARLAEIDDAISKGRSDSYREGLVNGYIVDDVFNGIGQIPDKAVGLIEIDPPYAISLHHQRQQHGAKELNEGLEEYNEIPGPEYPSFLRRLFSECSRVAFPGGWLICWCAYQHMSLVSRCLRGAGWELGNVPAFWVKPNGQTNHPDIYMANTCECFLYARRPGARLLRQGRANTFIFPPVAPQYKIHPTERPVELMVEILSTFISANTHIFVPFLGSGNTLLAASNLGCTGFGYDLSSVYRAHYVSRVMDGTLRQFTSYPKG